MKAKIEIDCENAAFDDKGLNYELADILEGLAEALRTRSEFISRVLLDSNGNRVGKFQFEE